MYAIIPFSYLNLEWIKTIDCHQGQDRHQRRAIWFSGSYCKLGNPNPTLSHLEMYVVRCCRFFGYVDRRNTDGSPKKGVKGHAMKTGTDVGHQDLKSHTGGTVDLKTSLSTIGRWGATNIHYSRFMQHMFSYVFWPGTFGKSWNKDRAKPGLYSPTYFVSNFPDFCPPWCNSGYFLIKFRVGLGQKKVWKRRKKSQLWNTLMIA